MNVGTTAIRISQPGNSSNAAATPVTFGFQVTKATQSISFNIPATPRTYPPGSTIALTGTSSSGLPLTYVSGNTNIVTVSGYTLHFVAPGTTAITASQPGNTNYFPANSVSQGVIVQAPQTN